MNFRLFFPVPLAAAMIIYTLSSTSLSAQGNNFFDDFQGKELNPSFKVLNVDKNRMALTQGDFLLLVTHKDEKNILEYTGVLPENYTATLRVEQPPENKHQGLILQAGDNANNARTGMYVDSYRDLYLYSNKTLDDEDANSLKKEPRDLLGKPLYLRLTKIGVEYEGAYSSDEVKWISLGKQVLIDPNARLQIKAHAWSSGAESPIKIDSFEINEILD